MGSSHPREVIIGVPFTERVRAVAAHTVVLVNHPQPNRELAEIVVNHGGVGSPNVHLVGDVTGSNGLMPAIHQAAAVARII